MRAMIMCVVYYMGRILYRDGDGITTLSFVVWLMVIINPYIIFNVGFVLSVLSVLGIILYAKNFSRFSRKLMPAKVAEAISLTVSAQLAVTPALVYYFRVVTPYAPFSNIVAVPLSAIYVVLGLIFIVTSPIKPLAVIMTPIINFFADGIVSLCENISSLPFAIYEYYGEFVPFVIGWIFSFYAREKIKLT